MRTALFLAILLAIGCSSAGEDRNPLRGAATYDGKPIPFGEILFTPDGAAGNDGPQGIATIRNGRYDTSDGKGVGSGKMIVRVTGFDKEGGKLLCDMELKLELPPTGGEFDIDIPKAEVRKKGRDF